MNVRSATERDCSAIATTYNHAVEHTAAIWSEIAVDSQNRISWMYQRRSMGYPVLIMEEDDEVVGYASFVDWRAFNGFCHTVEHSVYVHPEHQGKGIGRQLMMQLIDRARAMGKHVMIAGIESQNLASINRWALPSRPGCDRMNQPFVLLFLICAGVGLVVQNTLMVRITHSSSTILIAMLLNSLVGIMLFLSILLIKNGISGVNELGANGNMVVANPRAAGVIFCVCQY